MPTVRLPTDRRTPLALAVPEITVVGTADRDRISIDLTVMGAPPSKFSLPIRLVLTASEGERLLAGLLGLAANGFLPMPEPPTPAPSVPRPGRA